MMQSGKYSWMRSREGCLPLLGLLVAGCEFDMLCLIMHDACRTEADWNRTAQTLNATITDTYVPLLSDATFEGERVPPPARIAW